MVDATESPGVFAAWLRDACGLPVVYVARVRELIRARDEAIRQEAQPRWIPCGERMPPIGQWVLVVWGGHVQRTAWAWHGEHWGCEIADVDDTDHDVFSHWQPFPELTAPPEETKL